MCNFAILIYILEFYSFTSYLRSLFDMHIFLSLFLLWQKIQNHEQYTVRLLDKIRSSSGFGVVECRWICLYPPMPVKQLSLQWPHNGRDSVSNQQLHDCLPNRLFRRRSKKTWKLRVTGLCARNSPGSGEFLAQIASNAGNISIWWRHHVKIMDITTILTTKSSDIVTKRSKTKPNAHFAV